MRLFWALCYMTGLWVAVLASIYATLVVLVWLLELAL